MIIHPIAIDNETKLDEMLTHLDTTYVVLKEFGCFVALSMDRATIFYCPMKTDDTADRDTDNPIHMNWAEVTAPEPDFVEKINSVFARHSTGNKFGGPIAAFEELMGDFAKCPEH